MLLLEFLLYVSIICKIQQNINIFVFLDVELILINYITTDIYVY